MNDGFKGTISWNVNHPNRPLKSNTHTSFTREQLSSVYLVDDERIQQLKEYGLLLYGGVGSEIEILSSLIMADTDYGFVKQLRIKELSNWRDLHNYTSPCSDIILVDQYLFSFAELYDVNVCSLINEICSYAKDSKINIVILTLPQCYDKRTKTSFVPNWTDMEKKLRSGIQWLLYTPSHCCPLSKKKKMPYRCRSYPQGHVDSCITPLFFPRTVVLF